VTAVYALTTAGRLPEAAKLAHAALSKAALPGQAAHLRSELANTLLMAVRLPKVRWFQIKVRSRSSRRQVCTLRVPKIHPCRSQQ
jgi:hypothetical protein